MAVTAVAVAATGFEVAELRELAQVTLGGGGGEAEMSDDGFSGEIVFIGHESQNIDQFLGQSGLYRPFSASKLFYRPFSLR